MKPAKPYVNHDANSAAIKPTRLLKTGTLSARINATVQSANKMPIQEP